MSIQNRIRHRIGGKGRGAVFTPKDFLDLGGRAAVDQSLSRLTRDGVISRLRRGVYYFPKQHPRLGDLSPDADVVARAVVGRAPLQVSGAAAANALGLSTQVPVQPVYYSNRAVRDIPIGRSSVSIKRASRRKLAGADRVCGPVIQALKHLGSDGVDDNVVASLRRRLPPATKKDLKRFVLQNPHDVADWMRRPIDQLTEGA